jgi:hypothetical protein
MLPLPLFIYSLQHFYYISALALFSILLRRSERAQKNEIREATRRKEGNNFSSLSNGGKSERMELFIYG